MHKSWIAITVHFFFIVVTLQLIGALKLKHCSSIAYGRKDVMMKLWQAEDNGRIGEQ